MKNKKYIAVATDMTNENEKDVYGIKLCKGVECGIRCDGFSNAVSNILCFAWRWLPYVMNFVLSTSFVILVTIMSYETCDDNDDDSPCFASCEIRIVQIVYICIICMVFALVLCDNYHDQCSIHKIGLVLNTVLMFIGNIFPILINIYNYLETDQISHPCFKEEVSYAIVMIVYLFAYAGMCLIFYWYSKAYEHAKYV